jgi:uncharacterized membrane protein AbrB (regulator of aidB expression)
MKLPDIPKTWIIAFLLIGLIVLRAFDIDSWTTASISTIIGWLTGVKMEQSRKKR